MRSVYVGMASIAVAALMGCNNADRLTGPSGPTSGTGGEAGAGGTGGTSGGGTGTSSGVGSGSGSSGSTSGGVNETAQGFFAWTMTVLPSGELQVQFRQTGLAAGSFEYVIGGTVEGDVQCFNKSDNAPQGTPFHYRYTASTTVGAIATDGTIDATVTTAVMNDLCGNTKFIARPVTTERPFTWTANTLVNPAGTLPLPDISLGDAPVSYWQE